MNLSLVSHTNVGKTTLMRTLLRRDIGEVADRPHVTEAAERHALIDTTEGDVLYLWDTPGFGDSARLLKRLLASGNPLGWLQTQVWDRFTDRPFFSSQQAIRNVRDESDVVLYLVNAAEDPAAAGYVEAEMRILGWIGKPVLVLLNQTGPARGSASDASDEAAWTRSLAAHVGDHRVITLDAFARCWVQEDRLLSHVEALLGDERKEGFRRLRHAWRQRNVAVFDESMDVLAAQVAAVAGSRQPLRQSGGIAGLAKGARQILASLSSDHSKEDPEAERAMAALAKELDTSVRESTDRLIALHGLSGRATEQILARLGGEFEVSRPADVGKTGIIGGMVTGALGGLAADLSAGGLTFGAGALIGGVLGALGAGSAARAYNLVQGTEEGLVRWSPQFLAQRPVAALLRYLAVAHYGRGRGDWVESEYPAHWRPLVEGVVARRQVDFDAALSTAGEAADVAQRLRPLFADSAQKTLVCLYPETAEIWKAR
jgi:uncharacterized protein DUF3482/50S ribosome-binding GTPase